MANSTPKSKKGAASVYVIAGKAESLVGAQCRELVDQLLEPAERATGLLDADPVQVSPSEVLDELRTLPFLTAKRVVLIRGADEFISKDNHRELLERYFDAPCPTGVLVMTVRSWPGNTRLAKKLAKIGELITVTEPKVWQLPGRLIEYASEVHDKRLSKQTAEILVELAGDELTRLYGEIDKLALFADKEKAITVRHVELLIGHNRIFGAFQVIDAIVAGETGTAVERLRKMFAEDRSAEFTVVGAFAFHLRRMFGAKALLEKGKHRDEIARKLRIWSSQDKFFAQLGRMSLPQIGGYLQQLGETDYAIKRGQATPRVAMEQFVLGLAGPRPRAPGM